MFCSPFCLSTPCWIFALWFNPSTPMDASTLGISHPLGSCPLRCFLFLPFVFPAFGFPFLLVSPPFKFFPFGIVPFPSSFGFPPIWCFTSVGFPCLLFWVSPCWLFHLLVSSSCLFFPLGFPSLVGFQLLSFNFCFFPFWFLSLSVFLAFCFIPYWFLLFWVSSPSAFSLLVFPLFFSLLFFSTGFMFFSRVSQFVFSPFCCSPSGLFSPSPLGYLLAFLLCFLVFTPVSLSRFARPLTLSCCHFFWVPETSHELRCEN